MAATQTLLPQNLLTLDQYLHTSYHPDCDFVDGSIEHRRPPEGIYTAEEMETLFVGEYEHNKLQILIGSWFLSHESDWRVDAVTEQRTQCSPGRVRICDVSVLRADAPRERVTLTPPLICIEILSPQQRISRARVVLEDYRRMGVPNIWLIDPDRWAAYTYDADGLHVASIESLAIPGSPIYLPVADLLRKVARETA